MQMKICLKKSILLKPLFTEPLGLNISGFFVKKTKIIVKFKVKTQFRDYFNAKAAL